MENKVLAIVNGQEISNEDIETTIARYPKERQMFYTSEAGKKQLLEQLVGFELIYSHAKEIELDKEEIYLKQLDAAKKEILIQAGVYKILQDAQVTDKELEDYYSANEHLFKTPATVAAKHILVDSEEKASEIKDKIENGMAFEEAAMEYSTCPSNAQGGSLGEFSKGQMVPEFEEAAFLLEKGVVSAPVKTQFGYHLIKVEGKNEAGAKSFAEVKDSIKSKLLQERQSLKYNAFIDELKGKYSVEIK